MQTLTELMHLLGTDATTELQAAKGTTVVQRTEAAARSHVLTSVSAVTRKLTMQVTIHELASIKTLQRRWSMNSASSQASMQSMTPATQTMTRAS